MTFLTRAAALAAMTLGLAGIVCASTPGFALELDKTLKLQTELSVPTTSPSLDTNTASEAAPPADTTLDDEESAPAIQYASLADAVAAQDTEAVDPDVDCMARAIYFEAQGEPLSGQLAVAEVILNRTKSSRFPQSVCSVITQRGQFSFVRHGRIPTVRQGRAYRTAIAVARIAMADMWDSPASNAMYFHARRVSPGWRMTKVASIGNHVFYR